MNRSHDPSANDSDLPPLPATPPGLYRHYKGRLYQVVDSARHSESLEAMTVYRQMYGERTLWVRPAAMFAEQVEWEGRRVPRFARLESEQAPGDCG